jgi:hypothetical protein
MRAFRGFFSPGLYLITDGYGIGTARIEAWTVLAFRTANKEVSRMKKLVICGVAVLLLVLPIVSVYASPPDDFYLEKVCPDPDSPFCDLQSADPFADLNGGQIEYLTCAPASDKWLCKVVLTTADEEGAVYGRVSWVSDHGYFTLRRGEGTLAGLHAVGRVDWLEGDTYSLTGTYHVDPH